MVSKVYFGKDGLTSTSANYICNLAKEYYKKFEGIIDNTKFYKTTVSIVGSRDELQTSAGISKEDLNKILEMIKEISECKSLIAWLREAIKTRDSYKKELQRTTVANWAKDNNIILPKEPIIEDILTEEQYYANLPIKEMNRYYYLETLCAEIGKYIHENGVLNTEKEQLVKVTKLPYNTHDSGRNMTVDHYIPTCNYSDVESVYFSLQNLHRTYQAQLNSMKFDCEKAIQESIAKVNAKYSEDYDEYANQMGIIQAHFKIWRLKENSEIQNLKIVIPEHLIGIYNKIKNLGK